MPFQTRRHGRVNIRMIMTKNKALRAVEFILEQTQYVANADLEFLHEMRRTIEKAPTTNVDITNVRFNEMLIEANWRVLTKLRRGTINAVAHAILS